METINFFQSLRNTTTGRVLINAGWASAATPVTIGLGIIQTGFMARLIGPEGIGIIAILAATCSIVGCLVKLNNSNTATVFVTKALIEKNIEDARQILRYCYFVDLLTSVLAFCLVVIFSLVMPNLFNISSDYKLLQMIYGLTLVFQATYWTSHAMLRVENRFSWAFYQSLSLSALKLVGVAVLFYMNARIKSVVVMLVGLSALDGLSLYILACIAMKPLFRGVSVSGGAWWRVPKEIYKFQLLGYGSGAIKMIYNYLDVLLIGFLAHSYQVGLYRVASQLASLMDLICQPLMSSLGPEYSRLWFSGELLRLKRLVLRMTFCLIMVSLAFYLILFLMSEVIIRIAFGNAFLLAGKPFLILAFASLLATAMMPLNTLQTATGRAGPATVASFVTVSVQTLLLFFLTPRFGVSGAAWAKVGGLIGSLSVMIPTGIRRLTR